MDKIENMKCIPVLKIFNELWDKIYDPIIKATDEVVDTKLIDKLEDMSSDVDQLTLILQMGDSIEFTMRYELRFS